MTGHGSLTASRHATGVYLEKDKTDPSFSRAPLVLGLNLPCDDLHEGIAVMEYHGDYPRPSARPAYVLAITFAPGDEERLTARGPLEIQLRRVGYSVLGHLGAEGHLALFVPHRDRPHLHGHLLIDRRHPVSRLLWKAPSYDRIQLAMRHTEREFGLAETVGHRYKLPDQQWPARDTTIPDGARRKHWRAFEEAGVPESQRRLDVVPPTGAESFVQRARALLGRYFRDGRPGTWTQLEAELSRLGYRLVRQPLGLSLVDADARPEEKGRGCGASRVSPFASYEQLARHFGQSYDSYQRDGDLEVRMHTLSRGLASASGAAAPSVAGPDVQRDAHSVIGDDGQVGTRAVAVPARNSDDPSASPDGPEPGRAVPPGASEALSPTPVPEVPLGESSTGAERDLVASGAEQDTPPAGDVVDAALDGIERYRGARDRLPEIQAQALALSTLNAALDHGKQLRDASERRLREIVLQYYREPADVVLRRVGAALRSTGQANTLETLEKDPQRFGALRVARELPRGGAGEAADAIRECVQQYCNAFENLRRAIAAARSAVGSVRTEPSALAEQLGTRLEEHRAEVKQLRQVTKEGIDVQLQVLARCDPGRLQAILAADPDVRAQWARSGTGRGPGDDWWDR